MEGLEFNVSNLLRGPIGTKVVHTIDLADPLQLGDVSTRLLRGSVELIRTNFGILAQAHLTAWVGLVCDRCLDDYVGEVETQFAEEYLPVIDVSTGRPVQSDRTDETFFISPNHIVDLTEAARQHLLLALPMHPICAESCQGLCLVCGANRNRDNCNCVEETESPFSAIAALLGPVQES